ncbi:MAG: hypothetical protein WC518_04435 [Patescibacteria group bacterium]
MLKRSKKFILLMAAVGVLFFGVNFSGAAMSSDNYQIWADVISVGGIEKASSTNYRMHTTLGEGASGRFSSSGDSGRAGFREMQKFHLTLSLGASALALGELKTTETKSASHTLTVESNSDTGISVTFSGSTLACASCSGTNSVSGIGGTAASSAIGTSQFGFNSIIDLSQSASTPLAGAVSPYNTSGQYAFSSGSQVISATTAVNRSVFNINYIANINGNETGGSYNTTITYTATANF